MNILVIHNGSSLIEEIRKAVDDSNDLSIVEVKTPAMAVECLTARSRFDLVVVSMATVWGGSGKWDAVVRACGKNLSCIFIPDTCEILAVSGVVLKHQVVCPINTVSGRRIFSAFVNGLAGSGRFDPSGHSAPVHPVTAPQALQSFGIGGCDKRSSDNLPKLTKRQSQILGCIVKGQSNREIANDLKLAVGTVKLHSIAIYRQLGVSNRVQAVLQAQKMCVGM